MPPWPPPKSAPSASSANHSKQCLSQAGRPQRPAFFIPSTLYSLLSTPPTPPLPRHHPHPPLKHPAKHRRIRIPHLLRDHLQLVLRRRQKPPRQIHPQARQMLHRTPPQLLHAQPPQMLRTAMAPMRQFLQRPVPLQILLHRRPQRRHPRLPPPPRPTPSPHQPLHQLQPMMHAPFEGFWLVPQIRGTPIL